MDFSELLLKRRSVRRYTGESIPAADVRSILEAGLRAPNACNAQLWHFYVLAGADRVGGLLPEVCRQEWLGKTAFVVVITENASRLADRFGSEKASLFTAEDAGAAAENMALMAAELGYASCFVGAFDEDKCREYIGAKPEERPVLMLPVGVPAEEVPLRDRRDFASSVTFIGEISDVSEKEEEDGTAPFRMEHRYEPDAVFDDLSLPGAVFHNILLERARFTDINLKSGYFGGLTLEGSYFGCADLKNATFERVDFTGAHFKNADFTDAVFEDCRGLE